tara:strand:+ start:616 stop:1482 length:867 start_codon:yes stop_codon:yes gene_type:complete
MDVCKICKNNTVKIYKGQIRAGEYGKNTLESYGVLQCDNCEIAFLNPFPSVDYESQSYRLDYTGNDSVEGYFSKFDHEQTPRINRIGIEKFRNKIVADMGCGGGSFLDAIKGFAKKTIAIEPFVGYHRSLEERGHDVYQYGKELKGQEVDIIISFGVIEHTLNPLEYLNEAYGMLKDGGEIFIETDNLNDFLMKSDISEFESFFYRTAHYWYFNKNSLTNLLNKANFKVMEPGFRHGYDLSNALCWFRDRKPTGKRKIDFISESCNKAWTTFLEENGLGELLHFSAIK